MKILSLENMAALEGGSHNTYNRVCQSGLNLLKFAESRSLGFLIFLACVIIRAYCPTSCNCGGDN